MKYHVKWLEAPSFYRDTIITGKEVVESSNLGVFIVGLINDGHVVIQCEPI